MKNGVGLAFTVAFFGGVLGFFYLLSSWTASSHREDLRRAEEQRRVLIRECARRGGVWNEGVMRGSAAMWCAGPPPAN